jgi:signal transduction histidine kinase
MAGRAIRPARESFERQRAFVADASHEPKTPITLIQADAEVALLRGNLAEADRKLMESTRWARPSGWARSSPTCSSSPASTLANSRYPTSLSI